MAKVLNTGWTCPKCKTVYSPALKECKKCNQAESSVNPVDHRELLLEEVTDTLKKMWNVM